MRILRILLFLLSAGLTYLLITRLQMPVSLGEKALPPIGNFMNPFSGFWRNAEPIVPVPGQFSEIKLPNLSGEVQVVFDDLMVPHIFAKSIEDAAMVQGYVTAQHRLWQMDLVTRNASGRLSEVFGAKTLEIDRLARRRGMVFAAERDLAGWEKNPNNKKVLDAYSTGVNAWISELSSAQLPIEFKLLNYAPEPWTNLKTALIFERMALNLCAHNTDIEATNTLAELGQADFDHLFPTWNPNARPVVADDPAWKDMTLAKPDSAKAATDKSPAIGFSQDFQTSNSLALQFQMGNQKPDNQRLVPRDAMPYDGSNNWALAPSKTANGKALLANDPHLSLTLPSIWYTVQLNTPESNCLGVSLPGVPGVIVGFNESIAWGVTNVGQDVLDWYQIRWASDTRSSYLLDGQAVKADKRIEEIKVKDMPTVLDTVLYTVWGPVTYGNDPKHPLHDCAMRWIAHDESSPEQLGTFWKLDMAKNFGDYKTALASYDCPAQNFVFASKTGDIGIQVQGKFPIRAKNQGRFVQDGSRSENAWQGFIPQNNLPAMRNPAHGFVFSANQHSVSPAYPYNIVGDFDDWRNQRIYNRLQPMQGATLDSMKSIQLDNFGQRAAAALPVMLNLLDRTGLDGDAQKHLAELEKWKYKYEKDLSAPTLFEAWFDSTYQLTFDEITALREKKIEVLSPDYWRFIDLMANDTASLYFDRRNTPNRETARDMVTAAFAKMSDKAQIALPGDLAWGKARGFHLNHIAFIEPFGKHDLLVGGYGHAPNAITQNHGPSWRMIVELGETVKGIGVYPGGQSGNPGSPFYDNMVEAWVNGQYFDLKLLKKSDELTLPLKKQVFKKS